MPRTDHFAQRIGAIFLPEADAIEIDEDLTPDPGGPIPGPLPPFPRPQPQPLPTLPIPKWPLVEGPLQWLKFCRTVLRPGCYTISYVPTGTPIFGTRFRGTLRVEPLGRGVRMSGDLYTHRIFDDLVVRWPTSVLGAYEFMRPDVTSDEAADTAGMIPIYRRRSYHSYLKGIAAHLVSIVPRGTECSFSLDFDEFVYSHPATGFSGSFPTTATRSLRYVLKATTTPDLYTGDAFAGSTKIGTVSIRWVSDYYRRATVQLHTLQGAAAPPASVGASTIASIFADVGWDITFADGGTVPLPAVLGGVNINAAGRAPTCTR